MEGESVRSETSKSRRRHPNTAGGLRSGSGRHSHRNHSRKRPDMSPFQTSVNLNGDGGDSGHEIIEVQILPQDDNWGENTTAVTGNTSDQSISMEDISQWPAAGAELGPSFACQRATERAFSMALCAVAFFSPLAMVVMPKLGFFPSAFDNADLSPIARVQLLACNAECKGLLVSLAARMLLLVLGVWALYFRQPAATMPRIFLFRSVVMLLVLISSFAYWLFYIVQITEGTKAIVEGSQIVDYKTLVAYAITFADTLLFIHYVGVVLIEIRHLQPSYYVKVVRSPDGESRSYCVGQLSVQRAAVWVLQRYYAEFPIYNPYLDRVPVSSAQRKAAMSSFKYYEVDGVSQQQQQSQSRAVLAAHARRRDASHNERFHEEYEYERRVRRRRARLVTAAEEAFTHVKRVQNEPTGAVLEPGEAAQAIFPSMARALQKYLRVTRQLPRHTSDSILRRLAFCLRHDLSPRAFLELYLVETPVLQAEKERERDVQAWSLVCEELLSRPIRDGCAFQLVQNDVRLSVSVHRLPHLSISEQVTDPKADKFALNFNSETSV